MRRVSFQFFVLLATVPAILSACGQSPNAAPKVANELPAGLAQSPRVPAPQGGIAIPADVRDNLGITFATVEPRAVAVTRRVPGQFELLPTARHEYRAFLAGRVELKVEQFQQVAANDVLFTIDSPEWRQIQHEAVEAEGEIAVAQATLDVAHARKAEAQAALAKQQQRLDNLAGVNVRSAELESAVLDLRVSIPRLDAEIRAQETTLREAVEHYSSRLTTLASVIGIPGEHLRERDEHEAVWRSIATLPVRARHSGFVETLTIVAGGWIEQGELALTVIDPQRIRFRAEAPQSDIALFRDGQTAHIVPPQGGAVNMHERLAGTLKVGLTANERDRTVLLYATPDDPAPWAKPGIGGFLEVRLSEDSVQQLAVPAASIIQDGLEHVFFRRDPNDPDRVLRVVADLGPSDGRWVALRSGVKEGDQVVLEGVYALKLTNSGQQAPPGYHYHADGALHKNH